MNYEYGEIEFAMCGIRVLTIVFVVALVSYAAKDRAMLLAGTLGSLLGYAVPDGHVYITGTGEAIYLGQLQSTADHILGWGISGAAVGCIAVTAFRRLPAIYRCISEWTRFLRKTAIALLPVYLVIAVVVFYAYRRLTLFSHPWAADVPALVNAFDSDEWLKCCRAADALGKLGPDARAAIPALLEAHSRANRFESNQDWLVRNAAADALFEISSETAVSALLNGIQSPNSEVRASSCYLLAKHGVPASTVVAAILEVVNDEDWFVRRYAVASLGELNENPQLVVPHLAQRLARDSHPQVREWAANALGRFEFAASSAVPNLINGLNDESEHVRFACVRALARIDRNALAEAREHDDRHVREMIAELLSTD